MEKRYEHLTAEKVARKLWEKTKIYHFDKNSSKETFSIDTPPPTVSGTLHTGHIFSYTHTDIIARFKRMMGHNVFYPMGFDDNGLPTERYVEKKHKTKGHLLKRSDFIKLCLQETMVVEKGFEELWKTMGLSIDWTKTYSTISDPVRKISQLSFIQLYKKKLIYRKDEPSLYCTTCQTTVAQAELDDAQITSTFNDIEFETEDGTKLTIATTRPELIPACVAIFYHPDDERYKHLENKRAIVPLINKKVKILPDEKVDKQKGSGLVMCCTFGDQTDILWFKKHKLPFVQVVGRDGKWRDSAGPIAGLRVHDARKKALQLLEESGKLLDQKKIVHSVNVHERCNREIEYLILNQWFVKILENKDAFLKRGEQISWYPTFMQARYKDWVENLGWDWCISRQRFYGVPFPVWHCVDCKHVILAEEKDLPIDPQETTFAGKTCPECYSSNIQPDTDIIDTWFTSGLSPEINSNWPKENGDVQIPMNMRPQAHDIIRTWAFYTIVKAHYHKNTIPWKEIVISGHVLSGKGKISKSKGGGKVASPEELLKQYPADVIRYWTANGKLGTDTAFSENQLKIGQRLITKLWNAFRFCKPQIDCYKKIDVKTLKLDNLNKWLLHQFTLTRKTYLNYFNEYNYTQSLETVEKFFWHNFCDNYLELIKDQIFNPSQYEAEIIRNTQYTIYEVGFGILQLFSPITPHITETLYQSLFKDKEKSESIHITTLDAKRYEHVYEQSAILISNVITTVSLCRKLKTEKQLSLKTELHELNLYSRNQPRLGDIKAEEKLLRGITKAANVVYKNEEIENSSLQQEDEHWIMNIKLD